MTWNELKWFDIIWDERIYIETIYSELKYFEIEKKWIIMNAASENPVENSLPRLIDWKIQRSSAHI